MHVVMLVNNPCVNDSRVIKSAEALVEGGHTVTVVCRQYDDLPDREYRNGVRYRRIEPVPLDWIRLKRRIRTLVSGAKVPAAVSDAHSQVSETPKTFPDGGSDQENKHPARDNPREPKFRVANAFERTVCQKSSRQTGLTVSGDNSARHWLLRGGRGVLRLGKSVAKQLATAIYWFSEADEFGVAARRHIAQLSPDAVHAHDLTTLPVGSQCASKAGAWLIYDSHELEMHRNSSYPWFVRLRRRQLERKYIRRAHAVITVSDSIAKHLENDYRIPLPTVVLNAPSFDATVVPKSTVRTDIGLNATDRLCVYVGGVTVNRGLDLVVRALVEMPEMHFATVGPRRRATEEELVRLAVDLGVRERIHLLDPVAPEEVVGYIRTADVSVLPIQNVCLSYNYCMPNKLLESVFAGLPVVVSNLHEMKCFLKANHCGVVTCETDPRAIARDLCSVIENRENFVLTSETRKRLEDEYSWTVQADRLRAVYRQFPRVPKNSSPVGYLKTR